MGHAFDDILQRCDMEKSPRGSTRNNSVEKRNNNRATVFVDDESLDLFSFSPVNELEDKPLVVSHSLTRS